MVYIKYPWLTNGEQWTAPQVAWGAGLSYLRMSWSWSWMSEVVGWHFMWPCLSARMHRSGHWGPAYPSGILCPSQEAWCDSCRFLNCWWPALETALGLGVGYFLCQESPCDSQCHPPHLHMSLSWAPFYPDSAPQSVMEATWPAGSEEAWGPGRPWYRSQYYPQAWETSDSSAWGPVGTKWTGP